MLSTHRVDSDCFSEVVGQLRFSTKLYVLFANRGRSSAAVYWLVYIYSFSTLFSFVFSLHKALHSYTHTHTQKREKKEFGYIVRSNIDFCWPLTSVNIARSIPKERERASVLFAFFDEWTSITHQISNSLLNNYYFICIYLFVFSIKKGRKKKIETAMPSDEFSIVC